MGKAVAAMAFDLAEKLRSVSKLNTDQAQIEYLPFDLIDPDPGNFYRLEGLSELADSIATVGLLDPIRVRPSGERYTITSGHRRRAAIGLLIEGGDTRWKDSLPCIVDRSEATVEFRELQLIYANAVTRQLSSSEISRQAERVEALLVSLKEQGFEFPGRMQEHVAQAMGVHSSKLKRLHAIRHNAQEYVLDAFDNGKINESVAYELQKLPKDRQRVFMVERISAGVKLDTLTVNDVDDYREMAAKLNHLKCKVSSGLMCSYGPQRVAIALRRKNHNQRGNCLKGHCCLGCPELTACEDYCPKCDYARKELEHNTALAAKKKAEMQRMDVRKAGESPTDTSSALRTPSPQGEGRSWPTSWQTGTPKQEGWYAMRCIWRGDHSLVYWEVHYWREAWYEDEGCRRYIDGETTVLAWFPLPEVEG